MRISDWSSDVCSSDLKSQITKLEALAERVPTLNIAVGGSGSGGQLSLRGIGHSNVSAAFDSAVALDFDAIVVSSMSLVQSGFFTFAQIEILQGDRKSVVKGTMFL